VIGGALSAIGVGDFNGDNRPDLVVADNAANTIEVLYGNGDGSFSAAPAPQPVGTAPAALAVGDFNNDLHPDLAVANFGDGTVTALVNTAGGAACDACVPPVLGETVNLRPVQGSVLVELPHRKGIPGRFVPLRTIRQLPVGTIVDTSRGTVHLAAAGVRHGLALQTADLGGTKFQVSQQKQGKGLTTLQVVSPSSTACRRVLGASEARGLKKTVIASLKASAHGSFRTTTPQGAATVRGTAWDTIERCDGTLFRVRRGVVEVQDFRLRRTVIVRAGHSYLAKR
jgi:hypothetical protein